MYFGLSEEQSFFQDNVKKYLEEHATIDNIKHITSGDKKNLSAEIHQGLLNLGINGLLIPEEFGGLGLDLLFAAVVSEALGGGVGPTPFIAPYVMAPTAIKHAGSKTQQENYLTKIASYEYRFGVGFSEFIGKRNNAGISFSNNTLYGRARGNDAKNKNDKPLTIADACKTLYDRYDGMEKILPFAKAVSAKSHVFDEKGENMTFSYKKMMKLVKDSGYKGFIGVEYSGMGGNISALEGIRLTKNLIIKYAKEI